MKQVFVGKGCARMAWKTFTLTGKLSSRRGDSLTFLLNACLRAMLHRKISGCPWNAPTSVTKAAQSQKHSRLLIH